MNGEKLMSFTDRWKDLEVEEELGKGSYGSVCIVEDEEDNEFAIKTIPFPHEDSRKILHEKYNDKEYINYCKGQLQKNLKEIKMMKSAKDCPNIVKCLDYYIEQIKDIFYIYIKMPVYESLQEHLIGEGINEETVAKIGIDICTALEFCHKQQVIHKDIKVDNILVDNDTYVLSDFGSVSRLDIDKRQETTGGTTEFMAPEIINVENCNALADQYSLALTLYYLLNDLCIPFIGTDNPRKNSEDIKKAIIRRSNGEPIPQPINCGIRLWSILSKALSYNPNDRYENISFFKADLEKFYRGEMPVNLENLKENVKISEKQEKVKKKSKKKKRFVPIVAGCVAGAACVVAAFFVTQKLLINNNDTSTAQKEISEVSDNKNAIEASGENIQKQAGTIKNINTDEQSITVIPIDDEDIENYKEYLISKNTNNGNFPYANTVSYEISRTEDTYVGGMINYITTTEGDSYSYMEANYIYAFQKDENGNYIDVSIDNSVYEGIYPEEARNAKNNGQEFVDFSNPDYEKSEKDTTPSLDYSWVDNSVVLSDCLSVNIYLAWKNGDGTISFLVNLKNGTDSIQEFGGINASIENDEKIIATFTSDDMNDTFVEPNKSLNTIVTVPIMNDAPLSGANVSI